MSFRSTVRKAGGFLLRFLCPAAAFFFVELLAFILLDPESGYPLLFGGLWAILLTAICLALPRKAGRITFGILYYAALLWTMAQAGYYAVFGKLMWLSTVSYAGEGAIFLGDVISAFPWKWWVASAVLLALGVVLLKWYPKETGKWFLHLLIAVATVAGLCFLPELVFLRDNSVWGTRSEFGQSSSYRSTYNTMYNAKNVYNVCGVYQLTLRDFWKHELYPLTPAYQNSLKEQKQALTAYFSQRGEHTDNDMTGIFAGKNVILVLMESMDDWMITEEDTPTLFRMMEDGISFDRFYTPGYGGARTFNSEFCMNTGVFLPTTGTFVFDYVTNQYKESIASQLNGQGYNSLVFHYNDPDFYSRGVFEPALGYEDYVCYEDYDDDKDHLYDDCLLFDNEELNQLFFREGQTFNTIITRSAHLSYKYNEVLSHYALKKYPEYRGKYGSEEEDCARVKARLVDDMFARLLSELEAHGTLENTVIIGMTDHYTYGYKDMDELYALSGVDSDLELERTPCFIWAADAPALSVDKVLNTSDLLPTVLNLLGIDPPYDYLGQDAFDPQYEGYAYFPDFSFVTDQLICFCEDGEYTVLQNTSGKTPTEDFYEEMTEKINTYLTVSNLLLTSDYYKRIH